MSTGGSETVAMITAILLSRWTGMRVVPAVLCMCVSIAGAAVMVGLPVHLINARFAGYVMVRGRL